MVFVYLPFYFGVGVILYFVWRLAVLSWKRYGRPRRPRAAREVDGGAPDAPARTGNAARVLVVSLVSAVVVGLVGFAIGRATLPKGVFTTDFPEGWGPLGFEIPSILLGAVAASLFAGGPPTRRAAGPDAKDGAEDEWLQPDRGRPILLAGAALFLAFAALQYDYKLLGEVTKFSAGPVVSLELAQPAQNAKDTGNSGSRLSGSLVAAAQPRTQSINYVTSQLKDIGDFTDEDDRTAQVFSGVDPIKDQLLMNMKQPLLDNCIQRLGAMLYKVQKEHSSEFPSINGIEIAANDWGETKESSNKSTNNERIVLMSSLLIRRVYDGVKNFVEVSQNSKDNITMSQAQLKKQQDLKDYVSNAAKDFASAIKDYATSVISDYNNSLLEYKDNTAENIDSAPGKPLAEPQCTDDQKTINSISGLNINEVDPTRSNALGYLAMLTAIAEFADGNRESAIRLLHDRIDDEIKSLAKLRVAAKPTDPNDLYLVTRKQILIRRLIRVDYNLIELVQDPVRSPALDQIAFDLTIQGIKLDPILLMANQVKQSFDRVDLTSGQSRLLSASVATLAKSSPAFAAAILADSPNDAKSATTDEAISDDIVIAALKPTPDGRCSDEIMSIGSEGSEEAMKRIAFYLAVIDHLQFINNALNYVGKNGEIVLSASWSGDKKDKPLERNSTQSDLITKLDSFAGRLIKILKSQDQDPLGCLAKEGEVSGILHASTLLETIGSYFEIKGKNFGAAAAPRVADYDELSFWSCSGKRRPHQVALLRVGYVRRCHRQIKAIRSAN